MNKVKELGKLFWSFLKIGLCAFGGGWAMLSLIEKEAVEKHGWITEEDLSNIFVIAESTPGPLAVNSATFVGYKRLGVWGSVAATTAVALPTFTITVLVALLFSFFSGSKWVMAAITGIQAGVAAVLFGVALKLFKGLNKNLVLIAIFLIAFLIATFVNISVIYVILAGGVFGLVWQTVKESKRVKQTVGADVKAEDTDGAGQNDETTGGRQ